MIKWLMLFCISSPLIWAPNLGNQTCIPVSKSLCGYIIATWTYILAPAGAKWDLLDRILISNPLERQELYYYQLCDFSTD